MKKILKWILLIIEIALALFTGLCFYVFYLIYFSDYLKGTYEYGLGAIFFGWIPGLLGVLLLPINIPVITLLVVLFKRDKS